MNRRPTSAAFALGLFLAAPMPALAQGGPGVLPPYEIATILRSTGMTPLGPPVRRGPSYVLRALDAAGEEVRVVVDARDGAIVSVGPVVGEAPRRGAYRAPYPAPPPGVVYVEPEPDPPPPGAWRAGPQVDDDEDDDDRAVYAPEAPSGRRPAAPYDPAEPRVIPAPRSGDTTGGLPPPPGRFERRAAPAAPSAARPEQPPRRTASTARVSGPPPIPRPRPSEPVSEPAAAPPPAGDAAPLPPPVPEDGGNPGDSVPH